MRQRDKQAPQSAEEAVRDIRRATRRHLMIACLAGPWFHDGNGSVCAATGVAASKLNVAASAKRDAITPRRQGMKLSGLMGNLPASSKTQRSQSETP